MAFVVVPVPLTTSKFHGRQNVISRNKTQHVHQRRASSCIRMSTSAEPLTWPNLNGEQLRIGIVSSRWHSTYVNEMVDDVTATLSELGVKSENLVKMQVPGSFEIPMAAKLMCSAQKVDAVICLGVLIEGETDHYEYIASSISSGLMDLQLSTFVPMVFGVLTCSNQAQVEERTIGGKREAPDWARTAVEMGMLRKSQMGGVTAGKKSVGFA